MQKTQHFDMSYCNSQTVNYAEWQQAILQFNCSHTGCYVQVFITSQH